MSGGWHIHLPLVKNIVAQTGFCHDGKIIAGPILRPVMQVVRLDDLLVLKPVISVTCNDCVSPLHRDNSFLCCIKSLHLLALRGRSIQEGYELWRSFLGKNGELSIHLPLALNGG